MGKPPEIARFAATGVTACLANAGATMLMMEFDGHALRSALISVAIVTGLVSWVWLGRSALARIVVTIWLAFITGAAIAGFVLLVVHQRPVVMSAVVQGLSLLMIVGNCGALYFLWREPSTAWLQKQEDAPAGP